MKVLFSVLLLTVFLATPAQASSLADLRSALSAMQDANIKAIQNVGKAFMGLSQEDRKAMDDLVSPSMDVTGTEIVQYLLEDTMFNAEIVDDYLGETDRNLKPITTSEDDCDTQECEHQ